MTDPVQPWEELVRAEEWYLAKRKEMFATGAGAQLRLALASPQGVGTALRVLTDASLELVMSLFDVLFVAATTTHPQVGLARQVLGRLDPGWLDSVLSPQVEERLSAPGVGWEDYRRLAELLCALGQERLLAALVERAERSNDEDVREVAADFRK